MKKGILISVLSIIISIVIPNSAMAAVGVCGENLQWVLDGEVLTISGNGEMEAYENKKQVPWYSQATTVREVVIEPGVESISQYAFYSCENLESITIPNTITYIVANAFGSMNKNLTKVLISDISSWCQISFGAANANPLTYGATLYINGAETKNIIIPNGVQSIGQYAFYKYTAMESIVVPDSMTNIGKFAFYQCTSLIDIHYTGTEEQWNNIDIGLGNNILYDYGVPALLNVDIINAISTSNSLKVISEVTMNKEADVASFGTTFIPLWLFNKNSTNTVTVEYDNNKYDIQNGQTFGATLTNSDIDGGSVDFPQTWSIE